VDPAIFFPAQGAPVSAARAICAQCPHQPECLALGLREKYGIWGGTTEMERRSIRRRRRETVMDEQTQVSTNGNGSGHTLTVDTPTTVRVCPECSGPVPEGRKVTCSSACAAKRDRRHNGRTSKPSTPAVEIRGTGLGTLAAALLSLDELAGLESVTIETADHVVTINSRMACHERATTHT
jgi:Transcription factor WhiB